MFFYILCFYLIFPVALISTNKIFFKPKVAQILSAGNELKSKEIGTDWIQIAYLYDILKYYGHSKDSHKQIFQIYYTGFFISTVLIVFVPLLKKKTLLFISATFSALGALTGLSPHLTWLLISRILFATSTVTSILLNSNDEHFWLTFAGAGLITLVLNHIGFVVFSFAPTTPLFISFIFSLLLGILTLKQAEEPASRLYKLKDYVQAIKTNMTIAYACKLLSQAFYETCITMLVLLWNPIMFELSDTGVKIPSGLLVSSFACCMLTGSLLFHALKSKYPFQNLNTFAIISITVCLFLLKSLCLHCIDVDGLAVFLMCMAWISAGLFFASKQPTGDIMDTISTILVTITTTFMIYMTQNNFFDVVLRGCFWLALGGCLMAGMGMYLSRNDQRRNYVTI